MTNKVDITATCYDKKGRVLSVGYNSYTRTHPVQAHHAKLVGLDEKQYLHAEIHALLRAKDKKVHKIKVERYGKGGVPLNAAPCPICANALREWGVEVIEHTIG